MEDDDHRQRDEHDQQHLEHLRGLPVEEELPQEHGRGGDQRHLRQRVGQHAEGAADRPPPAGRVRADPLHLGQRVDHRPGHPLPPVEPADRVRRVVQQRQREPALVGLDEQPVHQGSGPLVEHPLAGRPGAVLHERPEVPLDRRLHLPAAQNPPGQRRGRNWRSAAVAGRYSLRLFPTTRET